MGCFMLMNFHHFTFLKDLKLKSVFVDYWFLILFS